MKTVLLVLSATALIVGLVLAGHNFQAGAAVAASVTEHEHKATQAEKPAVCELCLKPIVSASEVVLTTSENPAKHHYRCIHCGLVAARDRFTGDVRLRTKSTVKGAAVQLDRRAGKWTVTPASALVLALPEANGECLSGHVVLANRGEFETYAKGHPGVGDKQLFPATEVAQILSAGKPPAPKEAKCPVSGQTVQVNDQTQWTVYKGQTYYFCCNGCKPRFLGNPEGYLNGTAPRPKGMMQGHGEQKGSGSCGGSHEGKSGGCGGSGKTAGSCGSHEKGGGSSTGSGAGKAPSGSVTQQKKPLISS